MTTIGRLHRLKVADMDKAVAAQAVLKELHDLIKGAKVKGFTGSTRFVCLEHFDVNFWLRFKDLDTFKAFMEDEELKVKVEALIEKLKPLAVDGNVHVQNFVADEW